MTGRLVGLDIARGIAILGTLATNIWIFSHPGGMLGYLDSPTTPGAAHWQHTLEAVLQHLANGKFLGLLTLMFGIGLAIQAQAAARRGRAWPGPYPWRAAILFLDGLLHYLLVVEFDVLMGYALTGAIAAHVIAGSPRAQRIWIGVTAGLHGLLVAWLTLGLWLGEAGNLGGTPTPNPYRDGTWWDLVLLRIDNAALFRFEPVFLLLLGIAMVTLGNRLYRAGLFDPADDEGATLRRRLMAVGALVAPVDLALGLHDPAWLFATRYGTAPLVALGLLGLIAHFTVCYREPGDAGWAGQRLAELGRVALSGYVLQNIIASVLFYGWGLNLGAAPASWRLPLTLAGWLFNNALVLAAAHLWLRRWPRGPLEWLWAKSHGLLARETTAARPEAAARPDAAARPEAAARPAATNRLAQPEPEATMAPCPTPTHHTHHPRHTQEPNPTRSPSRR